MNRKIHFKEPCLNPFLAQPFLTRPPAGLQSSSDEKKKKKKNDGSGESSVLSILTLLSPTMKELMEFSQDKSMDESRSMRPLPPQLQQEGAEGGEERAGPGQECSYRIVKINGK